MKLNLLLIAALAAISAATSTAQAQTINANGMQLVAQPATVQANEVTGVEMVWQITNWGGDPVDQRIGVSGCADGRGGIMFLDSNGTRASDQVFDWYGDDDDLGANIARITCELASRV